MARLVLKIKDTGNLTPAENAWHNILKDTGDSRLAHLAAKGAAAREAGAELPPEELDRLEEELER